MEVLKVVFEGGCDEYLNYRVDGQTEYENFEVQFEQGKFNGLISGYKKDTLWENIDSNSKYYEILKNQAIIDYN